MQPVHVALYVEQLDMAAPSVKQRLAALRSLFDWLVVGQVMPINPAAAVRGPRYSVKTGKTPVLSASEVRDLVESIDAESLVGMRDRALIGTMVYTFARVGAVTRLRVEDVYTQRRRLWVRLDEKGGKRHEMPCHHRLEEWLYDYLEAAGIADEARVEQHLRVDRLHQVDCEARTLHLLLVIASRESVAEIVPSVRASAATSSTSRV